MKTNLIKYYLKQTLKQIRNYFIYDDEMVQRDMAWYPLPSRLSHFLQDLIAGKLIDEKPVGDPAELREKIFGYLEWNRPLWRTPVLSPGKYQISTLKYPHFILTFCQDLELSHWEAEVLEVGHTQARQRKLPRPHAESSD